MNIDELAKFLSGKIVGGNQLTGACVPKGLGSLQDARPDQISFLGREEYLSLALSSKAMGLLVKNKIDGFKGFQIIVEDPYTAFAKAAAIYAKPLERAPKGSEAHSFVHPSAKLGKNIEIFPHVYIGEGAFVGNNCSLFPGVFIGANAEVGDDTILHPGVVLYQGCKIGSRVIVHAKAVIGADGFGYAVASGGNLKIPQTGIAVVEDDVEIGPGCTIDRATLGETVIGRGSKLDSQVHVAHNCRLGQDCRFSALTGVAGSALIGDRVVTAGQVGISGHITIGNDVVFGAKSGVTKSVGKSGQYVGFPAIPADQWRRQQVRIKLLDKMEKRLKILEEKLGNKDI